MKVRKAYGIILDNNGDAEYNLNDELLLFDNYEQIGQYAVNNDINFERISVFAIDVEDDD